ncbi:MAG: hypothetical protein F6K22_20380 [Okeania sp. SIO2F4]|uniref:hypothetical protein n=1 Tax=Okeania sp. SIO2F4 TaxID=2607790 RepID=UPI00142C791E|nr:hypothetical protein [Okeania sp. SIO2F4]NES04977.1 hypothetical protein [Okeania sp. SIO2F4]
MAIIISLVSFCSTLLLWKKSNRPIIVAYIDVNGEPGNVNIFYDLVVSNIGNRPAVRIRLDSSPEEIKNIFEDGINTGDGFTREQKIEQIENCFDPKNEIVLLEHREKLSTAFGATGRIQWLKFGSTIDISITYFDLDGRSFKSKLPLKVYPRKGFSGIIWK